MYGYGDFDGPGFRASVGEFGRYGGRASLPNVIHWELARGRFAPPSIPRRPALRRSARAGGEPPAPPAGALMADRRTGTTAIGARWPSREG